MTLRPLEPDLDYTSVGKWCSGTIHKFMFVSTTTFCMQKKVVFLCPKIDMFKDWAI